MAQKIMTKAHALMSALNQAGNIGQHKAALFIKAHHAQNRSQSSKVISRNLRTSSAHLGNNAGLAHAGIAHETHVSQQLQLQLQPTVFTGLALFCKGGRTVGAGYIAGIALATAAALGSHILLAILN